MTVYADVLFLVNFSLDYVSLYITGRLMSRPMRTLRICAASALGACYAVCALFFDVPEAAYIAVTLTVSAVMCVCAYKCGGFADIVGSSVLLFSVGCALGGVMTAVYSLGAGYSDEVPDGGGGVTVAVAAAAAVVVAVGGRISKRRRGVKTAEVKLAFEERDVTLTALADSGNLLRDPVSGRSVIVVSGDAASKLLPENAAEIARDADFASRLDELPGSVRRRVRILPVTNVYGDGMLFGFRPDRAEIVKTDADGTPCGKPRDVDCIIAVSDKSDGFGGCAAVLPAELS